MVFRRQSSANEICEELDLGRFEIQVWAATDYGDRSFPLRLLDDKGNFLVASAGLGVARSRLDWWMKTSTLFLFLSFRWLLLNISLLCCFFIPEWSGHRFCFRK